jgi:hypothetical protein
MIYLQSLRNSHILTKKSDEILYDYAHGSIIDKQSSKMLSLSVIYELNHKCMKGSGTEYHDSRNKRSNSESRTLIKIGAILQYDIDYRKLNYSKKIPQNYELQ